MARCLRAKGPKNQIKIADQSASPHEQQLQQGNAVLNCHAREDLDADVNQLLRQSVAQL